MQHAVRPIEHGAWAPRFRRRARVDSALCVARALSGFSASLSFRSISIGKSRPT